MLAALEFPHCLASLADACLASGRVVDLLAARWLDGLPAA